ncbi:hypothetical protein N9R79_03535 [Vibrio sp.]|nr:hypothetical protein [Vibrio sp.]
MAICEIVSAEAVTPNGFDLDMSLSLSKAKVSPFTQGHHQKTHQKYTYAHAEFIKDDGLENESYDSDDPESDSKRLHTLLVDLEHVLKSQLLTQLQSVANETNRHPINQFQLPLLIGVPERVDIPHLRSLLQQTLSPTLYSQLIIEPFGGVQLLSLALTLQAQYSALMVISVDSLLCFQEALVDRQLVLSKSSSWGMIPSEGAAGVVLMSSTYRHALGLPPCPMIDVALFSEPGSRGSMDLLKLARQIKKQRREVKKDMTFGYLVSDKTGLYQDEESYGFFMGAMAQHCDRRIPPMMLEKYWGTIGQASCCSVLAVIWYELNQMSTERLPGETSTYTGLLFNADGRKGIISLSYQLMPS